MNYLRHVLIAGETCLPVIPKLNNVPNIRGLTPAGFISHYRIGQNLTPSSPFAQNTPFMHLSPPCIIGINLTIIDQRNGYLPRMKNQTVKAGLL